MEAHTMNKEKINVSSGTCFVWNIGAVIYICSLGMIWWLFFNGPAWQVRAVLEDQRQHFLLLGGFVLKTTCLEHTRRSSGRFFWTKKVEILLFTRHMLTVNLKFHFNLSQLWMIGS